MPVFDRPTRVAIVERCEIIRRGLAEIVESAPGLDLVATADDIGDAATLADRSPAVILIAAELLPGSAQKRLAELLPGARLVELVWPGLDGGAGRLSRAAKATRTLSRTADAEAVLQAVEQAARPDPLRPSLTRHDHQRAHPGAEPILTPRQRAVLGLIGQGLTNREIAERLGLTEKTVKNHVTAVLTELGVSRRTHAMAYLQAAGEPRLVSA